MSQVSPLNVASSPDVPTTFVCDVGTAVPALNVLDVLGSGGATTVGSGNTITIQVASSGFSYNVVTSTNNPVTLVPSNGYITKGTSPVQFVLPASSSIGDVYRIIGYSNLWTIAQNAGQTITIGKTTTTAGVGGSITATMASDNIELLCVTANTEWFEIGMQGNPTIV